MPTREIVARAMREARIALLPWHQGGDEACELLAVLEALAGCHPPAYRAATRDLPLQPRAKAPRVGTVAGLPANLAPSQTQSCIEPSPDGLCVETPKSGLRAFPLQRAPVLASECALRGMLTDVVCISARGFSQELALRRPGLPLLWSPTRDPLRREPPCHQQRLSVSPPLLSQHLLYSRTPRRSWVSQPLQLCFTPVSWRIVMGEPYHK